MRRLPEEMRSRLGEALGPVLKDDELAEVMRSAEILVTVGDVVTETALKLGLVPHIAIVDGKTRRGEKREVKRGPWSREVWVCNPPGCISDVLMGAIERAFNALSRGLKTFIFVEGEEDMASLPCIVYGGEGTTVIYGMPDEGAAVVHVNSESKKMSRSIISSMEMI